MAYRDIILALLAIYAIAIVATAAGALPADLGVIASNISMIGIFGAIGLMVAEMHEKATEAH